MKGRAHQGKLSLVLLFVGIFAFWWGIAVLSQNEHASPLTPTMALLNNDQYAPQNISGPIALQITQSGGMYTYSGTLPLASSCDSISSGLAVSGTKTKHVTILLTLSKPLIACAQASTSATDAPFSVSLSVAPGTKAMFDGLTVNGIIVPTTVAATTTK